MTLDELHQELWQKSWRYRFWSVWYGIGGLFLVHWIRLRAMLTKSKRRSMRRIGSFMWHLEMWWLSWEGCGWGCDEDEVYGFVPEDGCPLHDHYPAESLE